jgi:hypothetical protein
VGTRRNRHVATQEEILNLVAGVVEQAGTVVIAGRAVPSAALAEWLRNEAYEGSWADESAVEFARLVIETIG